MNQGLLSVPQKIFQVAYHFRRFQHRRKLSYPVSYSVEVEIRINRREIVDIKQIPLSMRHSFGDYQIFRCRDLRLLRTGPADP